MRTHTLYTAAGKACRIMLLVLALLLLAPPVSHANRDVYAALPDDIQVVGFATGEIDGDGSAELAVMYNWQRAPFITVFKAESGRWRRWVDVDGTFIHQEGREAASFELADVTGDGVAELLLYHLDRRAGAMVTTVLAWSRDTADPGFNAILQDSTAPPGYPLVGREEDRPAVTFLNMGGAEDGYRRVYCWSGDRFEQCREVVWEVQR